MTLTAEVVRIVFGPELFALLAALVVTFIRRARSAGPSIAGRVRGWVAAGALTAMGIVLGVVFVNFPGGPSVAVLVEHRFVVPLLAGIVGIVLCLLPVVRRTGSGTADLSPRTLTAFADRWWFAAITVVVALVLLVTFLAGMASRPDEQGRYTMHEVDFGAASVGTSIYGWYYSVPALCVMVVLVLTAVVGAKALARPPLADRERGVDIATRRWRTRAVLAVAVGALLVHLSMVLGSLAGSASVRGRFSTDEGSFGAGSTFAALEMPLRVASTAVEAGAWFLWFMVLFTAAISALRTSSMSSWHFASR